MKYIVFVLFGRLLAFDAYVHRTEFVEKVVLQVPCNFKVQKNQVGKKSCSAVIFENNSADKVAIDWLNNLNLETFQAASFKTKDNKPGLNFCVDPEHKLSYSDFVSIGGKKSLALRVDKKVKVQPVCSNRTIIIDAGHGGSDSGTISNGLKEKDITLLVAKKVKKFLVADGFKVLMTRNKDEYVALDQRTLKSNDTPCVGAFVSIHANWAAKDSISGVETFFSDMSLKNSHINLLDEDSRALAFNIQDKVVKGLRLNKRPTNDRGVKNGNAQVNIGTQVPAALIEIGFLSNS